MFIYTLHYTLEYLHAHKICKRTHVPTSVCIWNKKGSRRTKESTVSLCTTNMQMQTDVANEQLPTRATTAGKTMERSNLYRNKRQVTSNAKTRKCNQRLNTRDEQRDSSTVSTLLH